MSSDNRSKSNKTVWKVSDCPQLTPCSQKWENLQEVEDMPKLRYCSECSQTVHHCETEQEFHEHRALGHSIAIEVELADGEITSYVGGQDSPYHTG